MGATQEGWEVASPTRAAGRLEMSTVGEPTEIIPGPPGTQPPGMQGPDMSLTLAAG